MSELKIVTKLAAADRIGFGRAPSLDQKGNDIGKLADGIDRFVKLRFKIDIVYGLPLSVGDNDRLASDSECEERAFPHSSPPL